MIGVGVGVGLGVGDWIVGIGEGGGFWVFQCDVEVVLGVVYLGLVYEDYVVGGVDEVDCFWQCGCVYEVGLGLVGQLVVLVYVGVVQGYVIGVGGGLVVQ